MSDEYQILEVRHEALSAGRRGVRVRARLTGCPTGRWSRGMSARLAGALVGETASGRVRPSPVVLGDEIVLESADAGEAPALADALIRAVGATNEARTGEAGANRAVAAQATDRATADRRQAPPLARRGARPPAGSARREPSRWFG